MPGSSLRVDWWRVPALCGFRCAARRLPRRPRTSWTTSATTDDYLDSSALLKLLVEEAESAALAAFVTAEAGTGAMSSELAGVEVVRAVRPLAPASLADARCLVAQVTEVGGSLLGTLDALHLASALASGRR